MNGGLLEPSVDNLYSILKRLRAPGGCPWDREQTRQTLSRYMAEECAEALEAIDSGDPEAIADELGDLLMNVVFQAVVAEEKGEFTWLDVQRGIVEKMVRRHRHVFGDSSASTPDEVLRLWNSIKAEEKRHRGKGLLDGIPATLSALDAATKLQKKAAERGFDWRSEKDILSKIDEELGEVRSAMADETPEAVDAELGDLLFAVVNLIRFRKRASSEELLRAANAKFRRRFEAMADMMAAEGRELSESSDAEFDACWRRVKQQERKEAL